MTQGKITGVDHLENAIGQRSVHGDNPLDFLHVGLIPRNSHQQTEEVALKITTAVGLGGQLGGHVGSLQRIHAYLHGSFIQLLAVHLSGNALLIHAVGNIHDVFQGHLRSRLQIQLDVINAVQQSQIPRGKLEFVDGYLIALFDILLNNVHSQGMDNHTVVNLNHNLILAKEAGGFLHQQGGGECHEIQCTTEQFIGILCQKAVDGIRRREIGDRDAALTVAKCMVFAVIADFIADGLFIAVLNGLTHNVFAAHFRKRLLRCRCR